MPGVQRIVVKLKDPAVPPASDNKSAEDILLEGGLLGRMMHLYPARGLRVARLVTSVSPARIRALMESAADAHYQPPNFNAFAFVLLDPLDDARPLGMLLDQEPRVEFWYLDPDAENPGDVQPADDPNSPLQGYLNPAPGGLDVRALWQQRGSAGAGISFADVELGWTIDHGELLNASTGAPRAHKLGNGVSSKDFLVQQHGTRVLGVVFAADDVSDVVGIAPKLGRPFVAPYLSEDIISQNRADAIAAAIDQLHADGGGVLLLEIQIIEPDFNPSDPADNSRLPVEVLQAEFELIRLATQIGGAPIVVVECAGNGGRDLDLFAQPQRRKLNRTTNPADDSGAIMVAGATSSSTHRATTSTNFGSRIDCYAWGDDVVTLSATPEDPFNGTSAAGAIIAGACVSIQGIRRSASRPLLSSRAMRSLLVSGGTPVFSRVRGHSREQIGVMPDLKQVVLAM
jgi:hypothetical protein